MKKVIIGLLVIGFTYQSYAQEVLFEAKLKKEEVPAVIIESVEEDFPGFIIAEFRAIPIEFIEEDIIVNRNITSNDDYDTFQITLKGKGREFVATYTKDGKLLSEVEHGKNVVLPVSVRNTMSKAFPGWTVKEDNYKMIHYTGVKKKERYRIVLQKGKEMKKVYIDADGNLLSVHKKYF